MLRPKFYGDNRLAQICTSVLAVWRDFRHDRDTRSGR